MRLIDADELINFLRTENQRCITSTGHELSLSIIATLIECQPTAYSVDKVIEELKQEIQNGTIKIEVGNSKLFEIVKQGGVADDVCEWRLTDTKKLMPYKTSCGNEDLYDSHYKYCPYCSKKIKVVE